VDHVGPHSVQDRSPPPWRGFLSTGCLPPVFLRPSFPLSSQHCKNQTGQPTKFYTSNTVRGVLRQADERREAAFLSSGNGRTSRLWRNGRKVENCLPSPLGTEMSPLLWGHLNIRPIYWLEKNNEEKENGGKRQRKSMHVRIGVLKGTGPTLALLFAFLPLLSAWGEDVYFAEKRKILQGLDILQGEPVQVKDVEDADEAKQALSTWSLLWDISKWLLDPYHSHQDMRTNEFDVSAHHHYYERSWAREGRQ